MMKKMTTSENDRKKNRALLAVYCLCKVVGGSSIPGTALKAAAFEARCAGKERRARSSETAAADKTGRAAVRGSTGARRRLIKKPARAALTWLIKAQRVL